MTSLRVTLILTAVFTIGCMEVQNENAWSSGYVIEDQQVHAVFFSNSDSIIVGCVFVDEFPSSSKKVEYSLKNGHYIVHVNGTCFRDITNKEPLLVADFGNGIEALQTSNLVLQSLKQSVLTKDVEQLVENLELFKRLEEPEEELR